MIRRLILVFSPALMLMACNAETGITRVNTVSTTEIALPEVLRTVSSIDSTALQLQVSVNDEMTALQRDEDNIWRGSVDVPVNQSARVAVEWGTDFGTHGYVTLAEQQKFVFVGVEDRAVVFDGGYTTNFDDDNDTRTNLAEIAQNRSPVTRKDVFINASGTYAEGRTYPSSGVCGHKLPIQVLTRGTAAEIVPDMWWCATLESSMVDLDGNVQDIENIRITVHVEDERLYTDGSSVSENQFWHDDSVEIYIDGDNNKRGQYDGVNDFQFRYVPVGDGLFAVARGPSSFSSLNLVSSFEYFTGGYVLTAAIPLQDVGIQKLEFGINVEVSDDDDGGDRDAKYAWVAAEGVDSSWSNTRLFGTAQAE